MSQRLTRQSKSLRLLALCGIAAPIIFAILMTVAGFLYEGYSHATQAGSELGGVEAQYPIVQNANFFIFGILVVAFAFGLHRGIGDGKGSRLGPILVGIFGIITVAQAFLPCDPGCDFKSLIGALHNLTGLSSFLILCVGILVTSRRLKRDPNWQSYRRYSLITGVAALVSLVAWIGISKAAGVDAVNGVLQRVFIGIVLLWIEVVAIQLFRLSRQ
jgi:hypothetical membrane protein